ncbi:MAG: hypothetical protein LBD45_01355 [Bacteroidales bacterium]|jgi:hypothetical protein|nr:hypothetical protein [Bacteroidales bacterium]
MKPAKISSITLYVSAGITLLVAGIFFLGGSTDSATRNTEPRYVAALLWWVYLVLCVTTVTIVAFSAIKFVQVFNRNPRTFWRNFTVFFGILILCLIAWLLGNGQSLPIENYKGTENVYFWLKLADMFLYAIYALLAMPLLAMLVLGICKMFRNSCN